MHAIAREVEEHFRLQAQERGTRISLKPGAQGHTVHGDRVHLTNALTNLIDNALKYGRPGGSIEVVTSSRGGEFVLSVTDDGIGIRKEDLRHIFERFYRVHTGNVHDVKGFGLGLHYVKQIVEAHGGGVSARSDFGKGSTFILSLPLAG
jgi:two-component system phosphate regulon sensor histidine kinase PhoR